MGRTDMLAITAETVKQASAPGAAIILAPITAPLDLFAASLATEVSEPAANARTSDPRRLNY
jgi:hypothetical protein